MVEEGVWATGNRQAGVELSNVVKTDSGYQSGPDLHQAAILSTALVDLCSVCACRFVAPPQSSPSFPVVVPLFFFPVTLPESPYFFWFNRAFMLPVTKGRFFPVGYVIINSEMNVVSDAICKFFNIILIRVTENIPYCWYQAALQRFLLPAF